MKLSQLIAPGRITIGWPGNVSPESRDKWKLITDSVHFLADELQFNQEERQSTLEAVLEREESMTTGIGEGVALPHASLPFLKTMVAVLSIIPEGIDYESIDKKPANIHILILVPKNQFQKHIRTLASIARLMNEPDFRHELVTKTSAEEVYKAIVQKEKS